MLAGLLLGVPLYLSCLTRVSVDRSLDGFLVLVITQELLLPKKGSVQKTILLRKTMALLQIAYNRENPMAVYWKNQL